MREKQNIEQNTTSKWKEMKKVREQRSEEGEQTQCLEAWLVLNGFTRVYDQFKGKKSERSEWKKWRGEWIELKY